MALVRIGVQIRNDTGVPELVRRVSEITGKSTNELILVAITEKLRKDGFLSSAEIQKQPRAKKQKERSIADRLFDLNFRRYDDEG